MRDTKPAGVIGYVVVSLSDRGVWQGFFISSAFEKAGRTFLQNARNDLAGAGAGGTQVRRPGTVDMDAEKQPLIGLLSAVLAQLVDRGSADGQPSGEQAASMETIIGAAAWALREVVGQAWLLVQARRDPPRPGRVTSVEIVDAVDVDEAREKLALRVQELRAGRELAGEFEAMIRAARRK